MQDIWNPWHGCKKVSEGCQNCYMFALDSHRGQDGSIIYKTNNFDYPLQTDKNGNLKVRPGQMLRVCMTSDFFLEEADEWRNEAWQIIRQRPDVKFFLLTKRPERIEQYLPSDWEDGYENVIINATCENQKRADERLPLLLNLKAKHLGIMCAPLIGNINIEKYLESGRLEQVIAGGENYNNPRPCHYEWAENLSKQCRKYDIPFTFIECGSVFIKDGKKVDIYNKTRQSEIAYELDINYKGKKAKYKLTDNFGIEYNENELYKPRFKEHCLRCGGRPSCNGCGNCGKCKDDFISEKLIENYDKLHLKNFEK